MVRIESLLSARLFLQPQLIGQRIYFMSNLSGQLSLYAMDQGGSVPEPLLPPHIAMQNPHLMGTSFWVFPELAKILVMLDHDGDENYQPCLIPVEGGIPEQIFSTEFADSRVQCFFCDSDKSIVYFEAESRSAACTTAYQANVQTLTLTKLAESQWGYFATSSNANHTKAILIQGYTVGDNTLWLWEQDQSALRLLQGTPLEQRSAGQNVPLSNFGSCHFTSDESGLLCLTTLFDDTGSLGYLTLDTVQEIRPVTINGTTHRGMGELIGFDHLTGNSYTLQYNIDGCSWVYEATFDSVTLKMAVQHIICGEATLATGVLDSLFYDRAGDRFALSFCTATSPTQIYVVEGSDRATLIAQTRERLLGVSAHLLAAGEDASYTSFDGQRVSARLYLPADDMGFSGPRPLIYYVHGGPQGQERPDYSWFSMPLIQFFTLNGFAVFVPNVRGSTGYGLAYTKQVDHDWGGNDRLDHVHALHSLGRDQRLDTQRSGVMGRSYGGYMTLTLATRHPDLWSAAVDMFGPYDLLAFMKALPETWKPYMALAIGDPDKDRDFLIERSPHTYIDKLACPLLVIQGQNDPRVVETESRSVVEYLRARGKEVEYLVFENEGHDVLKFENRVRCYNTIVDFFKKELRP